MQSHAIEDTRDRHQLVATNRARTSRTPWILSRDTYRGTLLDAWELEMKSKTIWADLRLCDLGAFALGGSMEQRAPSATTAPIQVAQGARGDPV
jgi:hypothetical protein